MRSTRGVALFANAQNSSWALRKCAAVGLDLAQVNITLDLFRSAETRATGLLEWLSLLSGK
jgi:hypothetical protein